MKNGGVWNRRLSVLAAVIGAALGLMFATILMEGREQASWWGSILGLFLALVTPFLLQPTGRTQPGTPGEAPGRFWTRSRRTATVLFVVGFGLCFGVTTGVIAWNAPPAPGGPEAAPGTQSLPPLRRSSCRGGQPVPVADERMGIMPCVKVEGDHLLLTVDVTSRVPVEKATVFLWLTAEKERVDTSLTPCVVTFSDANQTHRCELRVTPPQPGRWGTATAVQLGQPDLPPGWDSYPLVAGTQSGAVQWPPA